MRGRPNFTHRAWNIGLVFLCLIISCNEKPAKQKGDEFHAGLDIADFNPRYNVFLSTSGSEGMLSDLIYSTLFDHQPQGRLLTGLAESWNVSADGTVWTIRLKDNIYFHDGSRLTAEDVKYSFEYVVKNRESSLHTLTTSLKTVTVNGERDIIFRLSRFDDLFRYALMLTSLVKDGTYESGTPGTPNGTGPFLFSSYDPEKHLLRLLPHSRYHEGAPALNAVSFHFFPTYMSGLSELMKGTIDFFYLTGETYEKLFRDNPDYHVIYRQTPLFYLMPFNENKPEFNDPLVRKALNHLIPREEILSSLRETSSTVDLIRDLDPHARTPSLIFKHDPEMAHELLSRAGWRRKDNLLVNRQGKPLTMRILSISEHDFSTRLLYYLSSELAKDGIQVIPHLKPLSQFLSQGFWQANDDAILWPMSIDYLPVYLHIYWKEQEEGLPIRSKSLDAAAGFLDRMRYDPSPKGRELALRDFEGMLKENPPFLFLFQRYVPMVIHKRFRGYSPKPWNFSFEIKNIWVPQGEQRYH